MLKPVTIDASSHVAVSPDSRHRHVEPQRRERRAIHRDTQGVALSGGSSSALGGAHGHSGTRRRGSLRSAVLRPARMAPRARRSHEGQGGTGSRKGDVSAELLRIRRRRCRARAARTLRRYIIPASCTGAFVCWQSRLQTHPDSGPVLPPCDDRGPPRPRCVYAHKIDAHFEIPGENWLRFAKLYRLQS